MSKYAKGRIPDLADFRDLHVHSPEIRDMIKDVEVPLSGAALPEDYNPVQLVTPYRDQGQIGSCTGQGTKRALEFFEMKSFGTYQEASARFLYRMTRHRSGLSGDSGAEIRSALGALALYGAPPEEAWPYTDKTPTSCDKRCTPGNPVCKGCWNEMPPWPVGVEAQNYQALKYARIDVPKQTPEQTLDRLLRFLAAGFGVILGFTCYKSMDHPHVEANGEIPYPIAKDKREGGHCIFVYGFNQNIVIENPAGGAAETTKGALRIANSWKGWGYDHTKSLGYLPYRYILEGMADDIWVLLNAEWLDQGAFGFSN